MEIIISDWACLLHSQHETASKPDLHSDYSQDCVNSIFSELKGQDGTK